MYLRPPELSQTKMSSFPFLLSELSRAPDAILSSHLVSLASFLKLTPTRAAEPRCVFISRFLC